MLQSVKTIRFLRAHFASGEDVPLYDTEDRQEIIILDYSHGKSSWKPGLAEMSMHFFLFLGAGPGRRWVWAVAISCHIFVFLFVRVQSNPKLKRLMLTVFAYRRCADSVGGDHPICENAGRETPKARGRGSGVRVCIWVRGRW